MQELETASVVGRIALGLRTDLQGRLEGGGDQQPSSANISTILRSVKNKIIIILQLYYCIDINIVYY